MAGKQLDREKLEYNWKWNTCIVVNILNSWAEQYSTARTHCSMKISFDKEEEGEMVCIVQAHIWIVCVCV